VPLSELCENPQYGFTASASLEPCGPKFVRITDLAHGSINWESVPYCRCTNPEPYLLQTNDLLFARTGATTGKTHMITDTPRAVFASYLIRVQPKETVLPEYLYSFFQSDTYWGQIVDEKKGSAQPNVNGQKLMGLRVPKVDRSTQLSVAQFLQVVRERQEGKYRPLPELPKPLQGKRRIVARIEELSSIIEEARTLRTKAAEETGAFVASASARLFNPKAGWKIMNVGDFCEPPQYGYTESATDEAVGPRFLRITDIQDGRVDWNRVPYCRCPQPTKYLLKPDDLVFARTGATTGKSFVIRNCPEAIFASYLIRLRIRNTVSIDYLYHYFQSPAYWTQIADEKKGTGQPNLNGSKLEKLKVPVAPLHEQQQIVAYLDDLQAKVDSVKKLQQESEKELNALMPSILSRAFAGEL
jgi:type I restriction enzyme, S subunit